MRKLKKSNKTIKTDFVIVGTGNIALRHAKNIQKYYMRKKVVVFKRTSVKVNKEFYKIVNFFEKDIEKIMPQNKQSVAVICSPASSHISDSLILAKNGFNILIEKPLSTENKDIMKLLRLCKKNNLKTLTGYNMRFSNLYKSFHKLIKKNNFGNIQTITIYVGTNFKKWRKNKAYFESVSAIKKLGGGVINELSHEIDYMQSIFDLPKFVYVNKNETRLKKIDVETDITALFIFENKNYDIYMRLNMLAKNPNRYCKIDFEFASVNIDFLENTLTVIKDNKTILKRKYKDTTDDMYIEELKYFKRCIINNSESILSLKNSLPTHNIINAMHKSLEKNRTVKIA